MSYRVALSRHPGKAGGWPPAFDREEHRLYRALGLRMTYQPAQRNMLVEIAPDQHSVGE